jgi:chromosome condensin MukBEF MukE localization factor
VVFRFIANFQPGAVAEEDFQRFIDAAEAWIIAKGSDDSALAPEPEEEEDDEVDEDEERDDFPAEEI